MAGNYGLSEFFSRLIIGTLVLIIGFAGWSYLKPHTVLATDGKGTYWDQAVWHSQAAHQPTVVLFTANWCGACRALHSNSLSSGAVQDELSHFTYVTVDLSDWSGPNGDRAEKYGVHAIPTLIRFDADGHETDRTHYLPPDELVAWLKSGE